jgi:excisionase family DNA binding protein
VTSQENVLPPERLAYSVAELSKALGVSRPTVYAALNSGRLRSFLITPRRRLISLEAALDFMRSLESSAAKADVAHLRHGAAA